MVDETGTWSPTMVSMRDYIGESPSVQAATVPNIHALYYWVVDFGGPARSEEQWKTLLRTITAMRGPKLQAKGLPHLDLECWVSPEAIQPQVGEDLISMLIDQPDLRGWAGTVLSTLQRPLYVGITTRLQDRLEEHLHSDQDLAADLGKQLDITDCALAYYSLPDRLLDDVYSSTDEADGSDSAAAILPPSLRVVEYVAIRSSMSLFNRITRTADGTA